MCVSKFNIFLVSDQPAAILIIPLKGYFFVPALHLKKKKANKQLDFLGVSDCRQ